MGQSLVADPIDNHSSMTSNLLVGSTKPNQPVTDADGARDDVIQELNVKLTKEDGLELGLDLDIQDTISAIIVNINAWVVQNYNARADSQHQIRTGDHTCKP